MPRKKLTPEQLTTVSEIASQIHKYEVFFTEQASVLQQDVEGFQAAHTRVFNGAKLEAPVNSDRPDYDLWRLAMEAHCQVEPRNFDDRVKIAGAAMVLATSYAHNLYKHPQHVMLAICVERTRLHEFWQKTRLEREATNAPPSPPSESPILVTPPRVPPPSRLTSLSWDEIDSGIVALLPVDRCIPDFAQVSSSLVGHVFVHRDQAADDDVLFKIIDSITSHVKGTSFEVQFIDCGDTIMIPRSELLEMVGQSLICWESL